MQKFISIAALLFLIFILTRPVHTKPEEVADYRLSLLGYSLGMSYDEAVAVRTVSSLEDDQDVPGVLQTCRALVDGIQVGNVEVQAQLSFINDKLVKVVARFSPTRLEEMSRRFQAAFGAGEDRTRNATGSGGLTTRRTAFAWIFPDAQIHLIDADSDGEFATVSLMARNDAPGEQSAVLTGSLTQRRLRSLP
jgi:hypothetical protein